MTLRFKLLMLVGGLTFFATTGVTTVALWREVAQSQDRLACEGAALAASIASAAPQWLDTNPAALEPVLQRSLKQAPLVRAWIVDRRGAVAACADRSGLGCPAGAPSELRPPESPLEGLRRLVQGVPLEASAPIVDEGRIAGAVRVSFRPDGVVGEARRLAAGAAVIAAGFIALGLLFGTVLVRHVTRPLTEVMRAAEALPEGQRIEVKLPPDPELTEMVATFNRMSLRLGEHRAEMETLIASLSERVERATAEGLRAERLATLGSIAAGLAHEMGNSLNVINGFSSVALRELPGDHANRRDLEAVQRECARAGALLERFLFFARGRPARGPAQPVESLLREAVQLVGPAAADAHVVTDLAVDADLPAVRADAELLRQAFLNLCVNAVQAMQPGGGQLSVRAFRRDGELAVEFRDTGPGVEASARGHIFEPFFTTKPSGTGLGLAIVRHAAEAHGGSVEVESEPGRGALFRIRLPAAEVRA
jgi:signal transduction histidine kinase